MNVAEMQTSWLGVNAEHFVFFNEMDFMLLAAVKTGKEIDN